MSFLSPALLIGLLAAAIPPIIHLILRRRPKRIPFAALEFIKRANRKAARRFRIRQFLLMATRSLLLAFVAFSIARPVFEAPHIGSAQKVSAQGALVLVLDASFEMGYRVKDETLLDQARFRAAEFLDGFKGVASLVIAGNGVLAPLDGLTGDLDALRRHLTAIEVVEHTGSLAEAVAQGESLLEGREAGQEGTVMVFTTPARFASLMPISPEHEIQRLLVDVSEGAPLPNKAVTAVDIRPAPKFGVNHWRIDARIGNFSDEDIARLPVRIDVAGSTKVRGFVSLPAGAEKTKSFYVQGDNEVAAAAEVIIEGDALTADDRRAFWFESARTISVLAVNGDPQPTPHLDELFYLERALASAGATGTQMKVDVITLDQLHAKALTKYDVVVLANPSQLTQESGRQLLGFVQGGGGLLTTVGNRVVPKNCNGSLGRLLPRPLRSVRRAGDAASSLEGRDRMAGQLGEFDSKHPILSGLGGVQDGSLARTRIQKYMLVEPVPGGGGDVVITLSEGAPFLVTKDQGRGRTALLTGTIDRDWGDLPIRSDFLPLMQRIIEYLARSHQAEQQLVDVGQPIKVPTDDPRIKAVRIAPPNGESYLSERPGSDSAWLFNKTDRAGHYAFVAEPPLPDGESLSGVVVGLDSRGSDLRHRGAAIAADAEKDRAQSAVAPRNERTELWHAALLMLFLLLASEAYLLFQSPNSLRGNMPQEKATAGA